MEIENIKQLKKGLLEGKEQEIPENTSNEFFGEIGIEKIEALKKSNEEIENLIIGRKKLSLQIIEEGEKIKKEINTFIIENDRTPMADPRDKMREKNDLRHKKIGIAEMQLSERINCWKDIANLKKELRVNEQELTEKEERSKMLTRLMEDED